MRAPLLPVVFRQESFTMLAFLVRRVALAVPTLALVIAITFTLAYYAPGDPIIALYGQQMPPSPEALAQLRHSYGLDRPYLVQLADYAGNALRGDFGQSISLRRDVAAAMEAALPISLQLGAAALLVLLVVGIPLSILAATHHNSLFDHIAVGTSVALAAVPTFVVVPVILLVFVLQLGLFDVPTGWHGLFSTQSILPILVLAIGPLGWFVRTFRAALLEAMSAPHVRTAHAKGLSQRTVLTRHVMRNAIPTAASAIGLIIPWFFVGAFFVESIFAIPGFGFLSVQALQKFDYPLILGTTIVAAVIVIASNLVADLVAYALDPGATLNE